MPFRLEPLDIVLILGLALILFGPRRLPEVGRGLGRAISEFRRGVQDMTQGLRDEAAAPPRPAPKAPAALPGGGSVCSKCGRPNAPEARFCSECGVPLVGMSNDA